MTMTKAEIDQQEMFDCDVYGSNKQMFETLLQQALAMQPCQDRSNKVMLLISNYNGMADSCMRLVQRARRKEHGHG